LWAIVVVAAVIKARRLSTQQTQEQAA